MHIVSVLGLIFAIVFGLVGFIAIIDLNTDIAALTSGGLQSLIALFPVFWMGLLGFIAIAAVYVAAKMLG